MGWVCLCDCHGGGELWVPCICPMCPAYVQEKEGVCMLCQLIGNVEKLLKQVTNI
jgi:hypothetical protein